jgi:hypothetical protein
MSRGNFRTRRQELEEKAGSSFVRRREEVVLEIGEYSFTRRELVEKLQCEHSRAAMNLNRVLKSFRVRSLRELTRRLTVDKFVEISDVGDTTLVVFMIVMEYAGIDSFAWYNNQIKFPTLLAKTKRRKKRRKRRR